MCLGQGSGIVYRYMLPVVCKLNDLHFEFAVHAMISYDARKTA